MLLLFSVRVALNDHLIGKELFIQLAMLVFRELFINLCVYVSFLLGMESGMLDLTLLVPDRCFRFK